MAWANPSSRSNQQSSIAQDCLVDLQGECLPFELQKHSTKFFPNSVLWGYRVPEWHRGIQDIDGRVSETRRSEISALRIAPRIHLPQSSEPALVSHHPVG